MYQNDEQTEVFDMRGGVCPPWVDPLTSILDAMGRFLLRSYQDVSSSRDRILRRFQNFDEEF